MNMMEEHRYVIQQDISTFGSEADRKQAFTLDGWIGKYLRDLGINAIVNDTFYAHRGILPQWGQLRINKINPDTVKNLHQMTITQLKNVAMFGDDVPTRYRGYTQDAESSICSALESALKNMKANRMVLGHAIQQDAKITAKREGRIILIDVGISRWILGNLAALELTPGRARDINTNSQVEELPVPHSLI